MATAIQSTAPNNATDAEFRAWGKMISDQLAAMGLVKTADTGQIDWATVVKPAAGGAIQGYEVWRFADTPQATSPFFLKLEYGANGSAVNSPKLFATAGTGTNGAGTLSGAVSTRLPLDHNSAASSTASASYFSGASNRFAMSLWATTAAVYYLGFERTHNDDGTDNAEGCILLAGSTSTSLSPPKAQVVSTVALGGAAPDEVVLGFLPTNASFGADLAVSGLYPPRGRTLNPSQNFVAYPRTLITNATTFSLSLSGGNKQFITATGISSSVIVTAGGALAMRYE